jgi:hypothetical protein
MSNFALRLPEDLKVEAQRQAEKAGISLNQYINLSLMGKLAAEKEAERFFNARAKKGRGSVAKILAKSGVGNSPIPGD